MVNNYEEIAAKDALYITIAICTIDGKERSFGELVSHQWESFGNSVWGNPRMIDS